MIKEKYLDYLYELECNIASEIRIIKTEYQDSHNFTTKNLQDAISYMLDYSNIIVADYNIEIVEY